VEPLAEVDARQRDVDRGDRASGALVDRRRHPYAQRPETVVDETADDALELREERVLPRQVGRLDGAASFVPPKSTAITWGALILGWLR
jgi:hypothetical protein